MARVKSTDGDECYVYPERIRREIVMNRITAGSRVSVDGSILAAARRRPAVTQRHKASV